MELLDFPIQLDYETEWVYVHLFTDIHRAASGCDAKKLRKDIAELKDSVEKKGEKHYWIGGGDWANSIGIKDRRHDAGAIAPEFRQYIGDHMFAMETAVLCKEFESIRDYGIGIGMGNHEDVIAKSGEYNPAKAIAEQLDLPFMGYSAVIRFNLKPPGGRGGGVALAYWHHGIGAARAKGGKVNMLYNMRDVIDADVYLVGHVHELIDFPEMRLSVNRRGKLKLYERNLLFINGGTYQRSYPVGVKAQGPLKFNHEDIVRPDYGEKKGYRPSLIGHNGWRMRRCRKTFDGKSQWIVDLRRVDYKR